MDERKVRCDEHGLQDETFVCQHIVQGLQENVPYGFFWSAESTQKRPDAWCTICNERLQEEGWDWTERALQLAKIKLLCGACYDRARAMNIPDENE